MRQLTQTKQTVRFVVNSLRPNLGTRQAAAMQIKVNRKFTFTSCFRSNVHVFS